MPSPLRTSEPSRHEEKISGTSTTAQDDLRTPRTSSARHRNHDRGARRQGRRLPANNGAIEGTSTFIHPPVDLFHPAHPAISRQGHGHQQVPGPSSHRCKIAQGSRHSFPSNFPRRRAGKKVYPANQAVRLQKFYLTPSGSLHDRAVIAGTSHEAWAALQQGGQTGHHHIFTIVG